LRVRSLRDLRPRSVADVDAVERREGIQVALALGVPDVATLGPLDHDRRVEVLRAREMAPEVVGRHCHRASVRDRVAQRRARYADARTEATGSRRQRRWLVRDGLIRPASARSGRNTSWRRATTMQVS